MDEMDYVSTRFMQILFILSFILFENFVSYQVDLTTNSKKIKNNKSELLLTMKRHSFVQSQRQRSAINRVGLSLQANKYKMKRSVWKNTRREKIRPLSGPDGYSSSMFENNLKQLADENYGDPCVTDPCRHGGTCVWQKNRVPSYVCTCRLGYIGRRCQKAIPECDDGPCRHRGDCIATTKGFVCRCTDGYEGRTCEIRDIRKVHSQTTAKAEVVLTKDQVVQIEYVCAIVTGSIFISSLIFCVHCFKVYVRRSQQLLVYENNLKNGKVPSSLPPGIIDTSNQICCETFCCRNPENAEIKVVESRREKTKNTKSKHKRLRSEYSGRQEPSVKRSTASRLQGIRENFSSPSSRQTVRSEKVVPYGPNVQPFQSAPSILNFPQERYSLLNTENIPKESESSRLLPRQEHFNSRYETRPSEILRDFHRISSERPLNNTDDAFIKTQSRNSQTEYNSNLFSEHNVHSEPLRRQVLPPHPPFPPAPPPFPPPPPDLHD